jgi:2-(1,2-epoxy-1,2-dihydrophenyl)acetyl-CoA isomerase
MHFVKDVCHVVLDRPERHNALVPELLQALRDALEMAAAASPSALVLSANGRSFSTGGDVQAFFDTERAERENYAIAVVGLLNKVILDLLQLPCPSIAAVHGLVTGGSFGLVLGCDMVVATPRASFAPWYVDVGFSPDGGWTALLPERIGRARALEIQLLNRSLKAEEALACGLIQQLVDQAELMPTVEALAATIAVKKTGSVARTLKLMRPDPVVAAAALDKEYRSFLEQIVTDEAHEGMAGFLAEK